jgi:hypothetical protein
MNHIEFLKCQFQPVGRIGDAVLNKAFSVFLAKGSEYYNRSIKAYNFE